MHSVYFNIENYTMKNIWEKIVEKLFPGTYDEYLESKEIHKIEIKRYRTNPQYIVGSILFFVPCLAIVLFANIWLLKLLVVFLVAGEMLIRDTISEHYCALLNRERKKQNSCSQND